jgi:hypothetical protein
MPKSLLLLLSIIYVFIRVLPDWPECATCFYSPHCESLDDDSMMMSMSNSQGDSVMLPSNSHRDAVIMGLSC